MLENGTVWVERRREKWMYSGWADNSEKLLISMQLSQMHFYLEHFHSLNSSIIFLSSLFLLNFSLFFHSLPSIITAALARQWLSIWFIKTLAAVVVPLWRLIGWPSCWYQLARRKWPNSPFSLQPPVHSLHLMNANCPLGLNMNLGRNISYFPCVTQLHSLLWDTTSVLFIYLLSCEPMNHSEFSH